MQVMAGTADGLGLHSSKGKRRVWKLQGPFQIAEVQRGSLGSFPLLTGSKCGDAMAAEGWDVGQISVLPCCTIPLSPLEEEAA